jgi:cytochrome c553
MRLLAVTIAVFALAALPTAASGQDIERGEVLFDLCSQCHEVDGRGSEMLGAPNIAGLDQWYVTAQLKKFRAGGRGRHFDDLEGMRMRPMSMTLRDDADVDSVAAYVAQLPKVKSQATLTGGDVARGQQIYATCSACHGAKGEGLQQLRGPALAQLDDWYLFRQLGKFKTGVRGGNPALDADGAVMRGMSAIVNNEQAARDVVAYIATLNP